MPNPTSAALRRLGLIPAEPKRPRAKRGRGIRVTVPIRTVSEANQREHWRVRHKRKKDQQFAVYVSCLLEFRSVKLSPPYHVTLTRLALRQLDPDNLAGSFKHVQDQVAKLLRVDDGDAKKVRWEYRQERAPGFAVRIEVAPASAAAEGEGGSNA